MAPKATNVVLVLVLVTVCSFYQIFNSLKLCQYATIVIKLHTSDILVTKIILALVL